MKAASSGSNRFRSLVPILGAVVLGTAGLAIVLFLLTNAAVSAGMPNAIPSIPGRIRPTQGYQTRTPTIEFAWQDVGVPTYTLKIDGVVYTRTTTSFVTTLAEGTHWWAVQAINADNEASGYGDLWSVTIDVTPPPRPVQLTPANSTQTASPEIDFTWTDVGAPTYHLRVDGVPYTTPDTSMQLTLGEGGHTWAVQAVDEVGNESGYTGNWTVVVDTTPPPVPPLSFPSNPSALSNPSVTFAWGDVGAASYDLFVEAIDPPHAPYSVTVVGTNWTRYLLDGTYNWTVRSRDALGNASKYADPWSLSVDTVPPDAPTLVSPADQSTSRSSVVDFEWSDVPGAMYYDLSINGSLYEDVPQNTWELDLVLDDEYTWKVRSVDPVGNESAYSDVWLVTVDTLSPTVTIVSPMAGAVLTTTHQPTVTLRGTAADAGAKATGLDRVEVNTGSGWQAATGTTNWSYDWGLPMVDLQARMLRVRAWDQAGNSTEQSVTVLLDTLAPTAYNLVHNQGTYINGPVVYSWSVMPDGAGILDYQIKITNTLTYSRLERTLQPTYTLSDATQEGQEYYAQVRARDQRGNFGPWSPLSSAVIPDLTPPTITLPRILEDSLYLHANGLTLYYTNAMTVSQLVEVKGFSDGTGSRITKVEFSSAFGDQPSNELNSFRPWTSAHPPQNYGYLVDPGETASGQIVATVHDAAGNTTSQTFLYEPDGTPPVSSASAAPYATSAPILVNWTATDTQSGVGLVQLYYSSSMSGGWLPAPEPGGSGSGISGTLWFVPSHGNGVYEFATRAKDLLGNRETGPFVAQTATIYDTNMPSSEITWWPEYSTGDTITGTWVAVPSEAPISTVDLWVRPVNGVDPDAWAFAGTVGTGGAVSGQFSYPVIDDGKYYFETVAHDVAGKHEPQPGGYNLTYTIRDSQIATPNDVTLVQSGEWSQDNDFAIVWTQPEDLSGIVAATYQLYPESGQPLAPVHEYVFDPPEIDDIHLPKEGRYTLWLWLEDRAGNVGPVAPAVPRTVLKYDRSISAPISPTVQPGGWSSTNDFAVSWTNPGEVSGITGAYYKLDTPPYWVDDGTWVHGADLDEIERIQVSNEGQHTVYVWLKDVAGNADHRKWASTTLRYDASPPESVSVFAPTFSESTEFEVEWTALDFHSGVVSYTVAVSGWPTYEWQPWIVSTTETSAIYRAPHADDLYDFRVTAYDGAGNSAQDVARVQVDKQRVYLSLSLVRTAWFPWHKTDVYEPNDVAADAYGPLERGIVYRSAIWNETDPKDFYYLQADASGWVEVNLTGMPWGVDLDLIIRTYSAGPPVSYPILDSSRNDNPYNAPERVKFLASAGKKYWVEVQPYEDRYRKSTDPNWEPNSYQLEWNYVN